MYFVRCSLSAWSAYLPSVFVFQSNLSQPTSYPSACPMSLINWSQWYCYNLFHVIFIGFAATADRWRSPIHLVLSPSRWRMERLRNWSGLGRWWWWWRHQTIHQSWFILCDLVAHTFMLYGFANFEKPTWTGPWWRLICNRRRWTREWPTSAEEEVG